MRQLLLRIDDDLHARLTERARRSGRSLNAVAAELLDRDVSDETGDARAALRARARKQGVLVTRPTSRVPTARRTEALASMRGVGPILDEFLADGR